MVKVKQFMIPLMAIFIFLTLVAALLLQQETLPQGQRLPVMPGLLAFSLALTDVLVSLRPKTLAEKIGLPAMYSIHGAMGLVLILAVAAHAINELAAEKNFAVAPSVTPAGFASSVFLLLTVLTGIFILSSALVQNSNQRQRLKKRIIKRERGLWVHRLSVLAILTIFVHMLSIEFVRTNTPLVLLSAFYVLLAVGGYVGNKVAKRFLPPYVLTRNVQHNPRVYELEFAPQKGERMAYKPGQYVFVRFIKSRLPKESHPFSLASAPSVGGDSLRIMIKESGDYTRLINRLESGDIATLEGPYGNFFADVTAAADTPIVMLAGGIGITPMLSILRSQIASGAHRKMILVWGLSAGKDLFLLEELESMKKMNDQFSYHITFSREKIEPFDHGQVNQDYLQRLGVDQWYGTADFFICGPAPKMRSMKAILKDNGVAPSKMHVEEFSF